MSKTYILTQVKKSGLFLQALTYKGNSTIIALLAALLLATVYNLSFWHKLLSLPDISITGNAGFLLGTCIILAGIFFTFFPLCNYNYLFKAVIIFSFFLAAMIFYFGLPYFIAPDEQKHIAAIAWLSGSAARNRHIDMTTLPQISDQPISHDCIFHSHLGIFGVKSKIYNFNLDIFHAKHDLYGKDHNKDHG